jgi:deoxyhypusine synthase
MGRKSRYLTGARILPPHVGKNMPAADLVERTFLAYNAGRLREGARLLAADAAADVTVG